VTLEVVPGVHAIDAVGAKVMLLMDDRLTLVDTGGPGSAGRILGYIVAQGRRPDEVERIVLTHVHLDHVGSLLELRNATGARVCVHESEAGRIVGDDPPAPIANPLLDRALRPVMQVRPVSVDVQLRDGDVLPCLGGTRVVHVPGHTRGSIALHVESRRAAIVGDALQVQRGRLAPPSRLFTEDMALAYRSIARLADLDVDVLIFSHYRPRQGRVRLELAELAGRGLGVPA
jgi:glyoxylase-like metal-dependent hydrolase (beta-lactamase superfamily II)